MAADRDLIAEGRAALAGSSVAYTLWVVQNLPALLDALEGAQRAIEVVQTAHELQLTRMAKERAKAQRQIERLTAALEAPQRPPLGYMPMMDLPEPKSPTGRRIVPVSAMYPSREDCDEHTRQVYSALPGGELPDNGSRRFVAEVREVADRG